MQLSIAFASLLALATTTLAGSYNLADTIVGNDFYSKFNFEAIGDPTHGRVNYVDQATAQALNLTSVNGNKFTLRADHTTTLSAGGPGRNSVRIRSNAAYSHHVAIFDVGHMPQGCGTWPAIWEVNEGNWPNGGEIDIIEGVNDHGTDSITLHAGPGCTMPSTGAQTGTQVTTDCNANDNGNAGCGVSSNQANSYGPAFNSNGGGWYAVERSTAAIKVWFWPRNGGPPSQVSSPGGSVNTDTWGNPTANFPNNACNFDSWSAHNIIINLTFCGDWAGAVFGSDGCPGDCNSYVNSNPGAFSDAFFEINGIHIYT